MSIRIEEISINKLFGNKNLRWNLGDVNVLVGKNGKGKSIILKIINSTLQNKEENELALCKSANIKLSDGRVLSRNNDDEASAILGGLAKFLLSELTNKNDFNKFIKKQKGKTEEQIKNNLEQIIKNFNSDGTKKPNGYFVEMGKSNEKSQYEKINTCYISTINMNANSNNEVNKSSGEKTTILAMETEGEIVSLLSTPDNEDDNVQKENDKSHLMSIFNELFEETEKEIFINNTFSINNKLTERKYEINELSSGEKQLIYTLLKVANSNRKNQIILMDEPEISLHLSWQEKLLSSIKKLRPDSQIIVVTHSPGILMDGWMGCYQEIDDILSITE
ncbi:AAA family ATPase [Pectobacterium brasiliense]|uniref:AAA family ATPase n=1 Tax=Pectobacterium brasiliense TaxID=180957 RepID=UPI00057FD784|nr:ATP-binding protein [Pectobacterium brasiliense]KHT37971.1 hypothetical protein RD02_19720 [Pectobacterium brasiliense]